MFTFRVDKSSFRMPTMLNLASFLKREPCGQTVLQDRSILKGQKLVENAKIKKLICVISVVKSLLKMPKMANFETLKIYF